MGKTQKWLETRTANILKGAKKASNAVQGKTELSRLHFEDGSRSKLLTDEGKQAWRTGQAPVKTPTKLQTRVQEVKKVVKSIPSANPLGLKAIHGKGKK